MKAVRVIKENASKDVVLFFVSMMFITVWGYFIALKMGSIRYQLNRDMDLLATKVDEVISGVSEVEFLQQEQTNLINQVEYLKSEIKKMKDDQNESLLGNFFKKSEN